jgi:hypothetical protein
MLFSRSASREALERLIGCNGCWRPLVNELRAYKFYTNQHVEFGTYHQSLQVDCLLGCKRSPPCACKEALQSHIGLQPWMHTSTLRRVVAPPCPQHAHGGSGSGCACWIHRVEAQARRAPRALSLFEGFSERLAVICLGVCAFSKKKVGHKLTGVYRVSIPAQLSLASVA